MAFQRKSPAKCVQSNLLAHSQVCDVYRQRSKVLEYLAGQLSELRVREFPFLQKKNPTGHMLLGILLDFTLASFDPGDCEMIQCTASPYP